MLTLFTIKKILFFGTLGAGIFGPIIGTSPIIREFGWSSDISPLKKGITNFELVDIYEGESVSSFFKKALLTKEGQDGLIESLAQELAKSWYFAQPTTWIKEQQDEWKILQESQFKKAWEELKPTNPQRDFWDNYWGSKAKMNSFWLRHNSYKLVKSFLTEIKKTDFSFNTSFQNKQSKTQDAENLSALFSKAGTTKIAELEKQENWEKIGFSPSKSLAKQQSGNRKDWEKFIWGKYEFINWSYRQWFEQHLPTYFWKISWYYDKNVTSKKLLTKYNQDHLKENFPTVASYSFPFFSESTNKKFLSFIKKISENNNGFGDNSQNLQLEKYFIEGWHGERTSPSSLVEVFNFSENISPEYISAIFYLLNKTLGAKTSKPSDTNNKINELKIEELKNKLPKNGQQNGNEEYKEPISIFFSNSQNGGQQKEGLISFDSNIFKEEKDKKHKHIYDLRETDKNWIFFRDEEGVHALALDGHDYLINGQKTNETTSKDTKEKLFNWFNFRNLQLNTKRYQTSSKKLLNVTEDWFTQFTSYLTKNFDKLLVKYYAQEGEQNLLFSLLTNKNYFNKYKDLLTKLFSLRGADELNTKLFEFRKKIIEKYSLREWELTKNKNNSAQSLLKQGLVSPFPYQINLSSDNVTRFPSQENVFNLFNKSENSTDLVPKQVNSDTLVTASSKKESEYLKLLSSFGEEINKLIDSKEINLNTRSEGFDFQNSQRLFVFDEIFDYLLDKLFSNKELLDYEIKKKKLLQSNLFGGNKLLKEKQTGEEKNLPWVAPLETNLNIDKFSTLNPTQVAKVSDQPSSQAQNNGCWTCHSFLTGDETKNKESLWTLLDSLLRIYFFRTYLTSLRENYFNFLIEFPDSKAPRQQAKTKFTFLTNDLFNKWRKTYALSLKEKNNFLDFLITLNYLSKNQFSKLKKALNVELSSNTKYHYLVFESISKSDTALPEGQKSNSKEFHPFLTNQQQKSDSGAENKTFYPKRADSWKAIREKWKTKGKLKLNQNSKGASQVQQEEKEAIFEELLTEQTSLPNNKNNLFNYKDLRGLLNEIKNITNFSELDNLISLLSKIHKSINSDFYNSEKIYTQQYQKKEIYLEEKKKLLIYQLLNINKGPFYSSKNFSQQEEKDIFQKSFDELISSLDKDKNNTSVQPTSAKNKNPDNSNSLLSNDFFKREMGEYSGGYFIQISAKDFEDQESLCSFFNLLPIELLAEFLIHQTDKPLNREKAQNDFFESTYKLKPRDMKFKNHINDKHLE